MKNYDFNNLSPYEFELLTRDLLQKHLHILLESFGEGKDQGIDLRYSRNELLIVQAKRYKNFSSLYSNLKNEVTKVNLLKPERYIISTSVSLSPENKLKIKNLFSPYIKNDDDILGKEDLNNLLTIYPIVEKNFFKLWLSSIDVLNDIFKSKTINKTKFRKEDILEKIKVYVQNDSLHEAQNILKLNKYIIISGPPGIGKTTLAEMLVFNYLTKTDYEFIFLSDSIDIAFESYNENKNQVFLFDDFLGRNFLQNSIATNEEQKIIQFINKIKKEKNKFLIFTTREYILNQAKRKFDVFDQEFSKCTLDISKYSKFVKAHILYNHLLYNEVPFEYVEEIIKQKVLFKIINHKNYNPRIIETFTNIQFWKECEPNNFPKTLIKLFDSPFLIWEHVYENQITEISRIILNSLLITGKEIKYNDLYRQVEKFKSKNLNSYNDSINSINFKLSLKELENSMIQITKDDFDEITIEFQNPSIQDFLVSYVNNDEISKENLLKSILFINPTFKILTENKTAFKNLKIFIDSKHIDLLEKIILNDFNELEFKSKNGHIKLNETDIVLKKLFLIKDFFRNKKAKIDEFIKNEFLKICYSEDISKNSIHEFSYLLCDYSYEMKFDLDKILLNISSSFWNYEDLSALSRIQSSFHEEFELFKLKNKEVLDDVYSDITSLLSNEANETKDIDTLKIIEEELLSIENNFDFDTSAERIEITKKIEYLENEENYYLRDEYDYDDDFYTFGNKSNKMDDDDSINNLFNSLK